MAADLQASLGGVQVLEGASGKVARVRVEVEPNLQGLKPEVRVAMLGAEGSGKSTLCGVLTNGDEDDGDGAARLMVFRHSHEIDDGRTSSVSTQTIGFDEDGRLVNYRSEDVGMDLSPREIVARSASTLTLLDLAGHEKYLKTTVMGLMGSLPDVALLVIDAACGVSQMTREHLAVAMALHVPVAVVLNKVDRLQGPAERRVLFSAVQRLFSAAGGHFVLSPIDSEASAVRLATCLGERLPVEPSGDHAARRPGSACESSAAAGDSSGPFPSTTAPRHAVTVPVIFTSQVSMQGMDLLVTFLGQLAPRRANEDFRAMPASVRILDAFDVSGVGTVVAGMVFSGLIRAGDALHLGPDGLGRFQEVTVTSIHTNRTPVQLVAAGQSAAFAVVKRPHTVAQPSVQSTAEESPQPSTLPKTAIRRGMVLVEADSSVSPFATWEFDCSLTVLRHGSPITPRVAPVLYTGTVRQPIRFVWMQRFPLRTGDVCRVRCRFQHHPEFLLQGQPLIFSHKPFVAIGSVDSVCTKGATNIGSTAKGRPKRSDSMDSLHSAPGGLQSPAAPPSPTLTWNPTSTPPPRGLSSAAGDTSARLVTEQLVGGQAFFPGSRGLEDTGASFEASGVPAQTAPAIISVLAAHDVQHATQPSGPHDSAGAAGAPGL